MAQLVLVSEEMNLSDESAMSDKETKSDKWHVSDEGLWKYSPIVAFSFLQVTKFFLHCILGLFLAKYFIFGIIFIKKTLLKVRARLVILFY